MENNFNVQSEVSTNENIPEEKLTSGKKIIIVFLAIILTVALVVVALLMCETITGKEVFNFSSKNEDVVEDDDKYEAENENFEYGFDVDYADDITVDENESDTTTVTDTSGTIIPSTTTPRGNNNSGSGESGGNSSNGATGNSSGTKPTTAETTKPAKPSGGSTGNSGTNKPSKPTASTTGNAGASVVTRPSSGSSSSKETTGDYIYPDDRTTEAHMEENGSTRETEIEHDAWWGESIQPQATTTQNIAW